MRDKLIKTLNNINIDVFRYSVLKFLITYVKICLHTNISFKIINYAE